MHFQISSALFAMMMVFATSTVVADICPGFNFGIADTGHIKGGIANGVGTC
jgi:hypothetical protein